MRAIKALIRKTFGKNHSMKTEASVITLVSCAVFVVMMMVFMASLIAYFYHRERKIEYAENTVVVNAPESFRGFLDFYTEHDEQARQSYIFKEWDACYDVFTFTSWMDEYDAYLVLVFPEDFDELALQKIPKEKPEILTYYSSEHPEYANVSKNYTDLVLKKEYLDYLQTESGVPAENEGILQMSSRALGRRVHWGAQIRDRLSRMVAPLLYFIVIMYVCMLCGMNAIAGEKERGTFAALLMTPVSRRSIVLGNFYGVLLHALIPSGLLFLLTAALMHWDAALASFFLVISLALLITGITILISCLSHSIVSAQTTFLPIFLILMVVCVTCMQESTRNQVNPYLPIYGHFYGIGDCLAGDVSWPAVLVCVLGSLLLTMVCLFVSERLLRTERFTVAVETKSDKELRRAAKVAARQKNDYVSVSRAEVFGYRARKRKSVVSFLIGHAMLPIALLSLFQPLAMIPSITAFMQRPESVQFIRMFRNITNFKDISDIASSATDLFGQFMQDNFFIFFMGVSYWLIIGIYILLVRKKEKNPLSTMGFPSSAQLYEKEGRRPWKEYLKGLGFGLILISSVYVLMLLLGQVKCLGFSLQKDSLVLFLAYILMWIPQGATEEIMMRGYMMPRVASRFGLPFAIFFSSMCFSLMHAGNAGFSWLALINLALIAALFAVIAYNSEHIYMVCAMHTVWNFCQGNLFGLQVSGNSGSASILSSSYTDTSRALFTGEDFGPEGGLCVTIVIAFAFVIVGLWAWKRKSASQSITKVSPETRAK